MVGPCVRAQIAGRTPILDYRRDENRTFTVVREC